MAYSRLVALDKLDLDRTAREEALNTLEAYIYRSRDFLEDDLFGKVSSDAERKSLKEKIEAASEWLFSSDSATYEDFKSQLAELTYILPFKLRLIVGLLRALFRSESPIFSLDHSG
jgi:hypoxia up-regulated 1